MSTNAEFLIELYRRMLMVRRVEERLAALFADGEIPGFIHLGIGQEAAAIGVTAALEPTNTLASNHRGQGYPLGKGIGYWPVFSGDHGQGVGNAWRLNACRGYGIARVDHDVTLVSYGAAVAICIEAARQLAADGIVAEVINLRSLQ